MKTSTACMSCLIDDLVGAIDLLELSEASRRQVIAAGLAHLASEFATEEGWNRTPSAHITALHRILKSMTGIALPFAELRDGCNEVGMQISASLAPDLASLAWPERFDRLVRWAIAGNHLDFRTVGTGYGFDVDAIRKDLAELVEEPLAVDEIARIRSLVEGGGEILYIPDNVGEIAFDALLVQALRERGARLRVPYREGPITSDATEQDFRAVGLDKAADEIFPAGPDTLGFSLEEMSPELDQAFGTARLVITKGQANFYAVTEMLDRIPGRVACLLRTKCDPAAVGLGTLGKVAVAKILK